MMLLLDNERRAQKLTADESRPRLPFWVRARTIVHRSGVKTPLSADKKVAQRLTWSRETKGTRA